MCCTVINIYGQFHGLWTGSTGWLRCFLQSPKQRSGVLCVFVQIVQNHEQQYFHGSSRAKPGDNAENVIHEKNIKRSSSYYPFSYLYYSSTKNISL